jgi:membrane-associated phospholipid phosphatase
MRRIVTPPAMVLYLTCLLGVVLFVFSPQAFAGVILAGNEPVSAAAISLPYYDPYDCQKCHILFPLSDESADLQLNCEGSKDPGIFRDLLAIYKSPIEFNKKDLCFLLIIGGSLFLVDQGIYNSINGGPKTPEDWGTGKFISSFGDGLPALGICGLISIKDPRTGYLAVNAVAYSGLACYTLKLALGRARPWTGEGPYAFHGVGINDSYNSMPSGHSAVAFALATVLAKQYPEHKYIFYTCACIIGLSRIYVHSHWPSDVFIGAAIGIWSANQVMASSRIFEIKW